MTTNARDEKWSSWMENRGIQPKHETVQVKFKDGYTDEDHVSAYYWQIDHDEADIIAYRYKIKEPESVEVTEAEEEAWQAKEREMSIDEARAILSNDNVNHPQHYQSDNGIECIDAIRAALGVGGFVAHCRGTAIKYAFRAGKKQAHAEDLRKAAWYLERAANALEE